jgi:catechol 2,3-dioxygenase-like lactoylglutathione lyase family enzyme
MVRMVSIVALAALAACSSEPESLREAAFASHQEEELSSARPILNVNDLQASLRYYRDELGFRVDWEHGEPADFGSVSRGEAIIFLCEGCQGTPGGWLMVFARDVDALFDEYADPDARIRMAPKNMPWGNVIRFGTGGE